MAAPPSPSGELVLCLDRVPEGVGSDYLFTLQEGDPVTFAGPLGNFTLPEGTEDLLWLARYTGIVPFRAMLQHLERNPPSRQVRLLYSAPRPEDLAYHSELLRAAEERPWFELTALVDAPDEEWAGLTGSVLDLLPELLEGARPVTPMVCGKREFVRPARDFFYERGYEKRAVKWENYD
jgi:NAD(P)H-flavin reductase